MGTALCDCSQFELRSCKSATFTFIRTLINQTTRNMSAELACTYAALILHDDDIEITADKLAALLKAAKVDVEPFWPSLFAGALKNCDVNDLVTKLGSCFGGAPAAAGGAAPAEDKKEAKKEESEEEEDDDMGFG